MDTYDVCAGIVQGCAGHPDQWGQRHPARPARHHRPAHLPEVRGPEREVPRLARLSANPVHPRSLPQK